MKPMVLVCVGALSLWGASPPALAKCRSTGVRWVAGLDQPVPTNVQPVLEAYGRAQELAAALSSLEPSLDSQDDVVPVRVAETLVGEMMLTQAVLVPVRPLRPSRTYRLHLRRVPPRHAAEAEAFQHLSLRTGSVEDRTPPTLDDAPVVGAGSYQEFGCGPAVTVPVRVDAHDDDGGPLTVVVQRAGPGGKPGTRFILPLEDGVATLGQTMCSGSLVLVSGGQHTVDLTVRDLAGHTSGPPARVTFGAPEPTR